MAHQRTSDSGWQLVGSVRNPWGRVPTTDGGRALDGRSLDYAQRLAKKANAPDIASRRHHYVPRSYLKAWAEDGKRVWALNTESGALKPLGIANLCVEEDFHRIPGPDGAHHNKVEALFGVVSRVRRLFNDVEDPETLTFDDLIGVSTAVSMQRMRTAQQRRLMRQYDQWFHAQPYKQEGWRDLDDNLNLASLHTNLVFDAMWRASDILSFKQIEIWHDPKGRFWTCDNPVLLPWKGTRVVPVDTATPIVWPVSPFRAVAFVEEHAGAKAVIRVATPKMIGTVRQAVIRSRERMIFASADDKDALPVGRRFPRRRQLLLQCSRHTPDGRPVEPPGCCVERSEIFAHKPIVNLCANGLHEKAPGMDELS